MNWFAVINMAGYLPEGDGLVTEEWETARDFLVEEAQSGAEAAWEVFADSKDPEDERQGKAFEDGIQELRDLIPDVPADVYISYRSGFLAYNIVPTNEPIPDE